MPAAVSEPSRSRWWPHAVALAICLGAYWSASGLLQFHEVFFAPVTATAAPRPTATTATASSSLLQPTRQYDRLVVVLIDAMRADMVLGSDAMYGRAHSGKHADDQTHELSRHMNFTRSLLASGMAAGYVAHASVPTVTMPRLKALLSGKPPAFIDILKNFNSVALADENVVQLMRDSGFRIVFYGDDTWLKLFPDSFQRSEGTSGFYTRDTVEVDDNVTRHLRDELDPSLQHPQSRDWDVLVLHYLGLDHVGHLRGPRSPMMQDKLHEMDDVVKLVYESVLRQDTVRREEAGEHADRVKPTLIALCSDHGMSEIGNHGGATVEEASALMAFMRGDGRAFQAGTQVLAERRLQVDLVPTIAALFGLPIPTYSTGMLLDRIVDTSSTKGSDVDLVKALYANLLQLRQLVHVKFPEAGVIHPDVKKLDERVHQRLVTHAASPKEDDADLVHMLRVACQQLQERVARSDGSEYDTILIGAGVAVLLTCAMVALYFALESSRKRSISGSSVTVRVAISAFVVTIVNLSSTSSIENEHATVFFVTTTFLVAVGIDVARATTNGAQQLLLLLYLFASLLCVRLLRERSQVINFARLNGMAVDSSLPGNEFATDDSLSVWYTGPLFASIELPQAAYFTIIYCAVISGMFHEWKKVTRFGYIWSGTAFVIFTVGMVVNAWCSHLIEYDGPRGDIDIAARCVYALTLLLSTLGLCSRGKITSASSEMALWVLTSMMQKPSNVPTFAVLCILLQLLSAVFRARVTWLPTQFTGLFAVWLSSAAFFALGNSHLVTTIDISQSYHGLDGYSQELVGLLTFLNVFSGPLVVIARFSSWIPISLDGSKSTAATASMWIVLSYQAFRMGFYTIIVYFMRFHLFIWSVFAPKMLYEVVFAVFVSVSTASVS